MRNDNEDVNSLPATNDSVAEILAENYGKQFIEDLHALFSVPGFKPDILSLREQYGIDPLSTLEDKYIQQYIVDSMSRKVYGMPANVSVQDPQKFINMWEEFTLALEGIVELHGVSKIWTWPLAVYIAKDDVSTLDSVRGLVSVSMNKQTKELTIKISSDSRSKEDLESIAATIYESWNHLREVPAQWRPSRNAKRDSDITLYKHTHTAQQTAEKFNLDLETINKILQRERKKHRSMK